MSQIVLCGSMKQAASLLVYKRVLTHHGFDCVVPDWAQSEFLASEQPAFKSSSEYLRFKAGVTRQYFASIADAKTVAVLAVNAHTASGLNYIGPATFSELSVGFYKDKPLFVAYNMYKPYSDELSAWNTTVLKGQLEPLLNSLI